MYMSDNMSCLTCTCLCWFMLSDMYMFMLIHVIWYVHVYADSCCLTCTCLCWFMLSDMYMSMLIHVVWHVHAYADSCYLTCTCLCWFMLSHMYMFMLIHVVWHVHVYADSCYLHNHVHVNQHNHVHVRQYESTQTRSNYTTRNNIITSMSDNMNQHRHTPSWIFMVLVHWNNSPGRQVAQLGHIILIPKFYLVHSGEATNTNLIVFVIWSDGARVHGLPHSMWAR
jgi:hypothetical protein